MIRKKRLTFNLQTYNRSLKYQSTLNKNLLIIFILFTIARNHAVAQNLVVNGDFEAVNRCTEYKEYCSPVGWRSTSQKLFGYIKKRENRYIKLLLFKKKKANQRKFAQTELSCPLEKGERYEVSMKIKANLFGINSICVGFSDAFQYEDDIDFLQVYSNKKCVDISQVLKKDEWVEVKFEYEAIGFEQFVCIGNLQEDSETEYVILDEEEYKKLQKSYEPQGTVEYGIDDVVIRKMNGTSCEDMEVRRKSIIANKNRHTHHWEFYGNARTGSSLELKKDESGLEQKEPSLLKKPTVELNQEFVLENLSFANNQYQLTTENIEELDFIIKEMLMDKSIRIKITGHTDSKGSKRYNQQLSLKRAQSVRSYLVKKGLDEKRMEVQGKGQSEPLVLEEDEASRKINRRVVINIL